MGKLLGMLSVDLNTQMMLELLSDNFTKGGKNAGCKGDCGI
jgi:hypothetical protein